MTAIVSQPPPAVFYGVATALVTQSLIQANGIMIFHRYFQTHNAQAEPTCLFLSCFYEGAAYTSAAKAGTNVKCKHAERFGLAAAVAAYAYCADHTSVHLCHQHLSVPLLMLLPAMSHLPSTDFRCGSIN
jgi:hypothetical protein